MAGARQFPQGSNNDGVGARQWPPEAASGGGGVTPGGGSSGFTNTYINLANIAGEIDEGPLPLYRFVDSTGAIQIWILQQGAAAPTTARFGVEPRYTVGDVGGLLTVHAGDGAPANAGTVAGAGGAGVLTGGIGGAGSAAQVAGAGGAARILAGIPGADGGGGGAAGGSVVIAPSDGTGAGVNGDVLIGTAHAAGYAARFVQVGPAAGSIPLLIDVAAPLSTEVLSVMPDTDGPGAASATAVIGRGRFGAVYTDNLALSHVDHFSTTGFMLRQGSGGDVVFNVPSAGVLYITKNGAFGDGWELGTGGGTMHILPLTTAANDIGNATFKVRDLHLSRDAYVGDDVEFLLGVAHDCGVATSTAATIVGGALTVFAGTGAVAQGASAGAIGGALTLSGGVGGAGITGVSPGSGGAVAISGGAGGARVNSGGSSGGSVTIDGGDGAGVGTGQGGSITLTAGGGGTTGVAGNINLTVDDADATYGAINIATGGGAQRVGFFGVTAVVQQANITNPTGGAVIDTQARTAIDAILAMLEAYGISA